MIQVKAFYAYNDLRNFSYLISDDQSGSSWVIDPYEANPIIDYIKKNGLVLKGILNTHGHFDHIRGNGPLHEYFGSPVLKLNHSASIDLGEGNELKTMDTPGHTMDHQVFIWKNNSEETALFSGDTLFNAGVGNCHNGGNVDLLYATTRELINHLPPETKLYPGHDYLRNNLEFAKSVEPENNEINEFLKKLEGEATEARSPMTLGEEKKYNPFLRLTSEEIRQNLLNKTNLNQGKDEVEKEVFIKLRVLRYHC